MSADKNGVIVLIAHPNASNITELYLASIIPVHSSVIINAIHDLADDFKPYMKRLADIYKTDTLELRGLTQFEYNQMFIPHSRALAEEIEVDEFIEVVARVVKYAKQFS